MNADSLIFDAMHRPHSYAERMDPEFPIVYRCDRCGKLGTGPRKHLQEAVREHLETCAVPVKTESVLRLYYPRS